MIIVMLKKSPYFMVVAFILRYSEQNRCYIFPVSILFQ
jgi:hypothetical protein